MFKSQAVINYIAIEIVGYTYGKRVSRSIAHRILCNSSMSYGGGDNDWIRLDLGKTSSLIEYAEPAAILIRNLVGDCVLRIPDGDPSGDFMNVSITMIPSGTDAFEHFTRATIYPAPPMHVVAIINHEVYTTRIEYKEKCGLEYVKKT